MDADRMVPTDRIAERIRAARRDAGLSQEELARLVGVSRSAVAQWETGRSGQLGVHLSRVASVLGVDAGWLLNGAPTKDRDAVEATGDERALLRLYRGCTAEDRQILLRMAVRMARTGA